MDRLPPIVSTTIILSLIAIWYAWPFVLGAVSIWALIGGL